MKKTMKKKIKNKRALIVLPARLNSNRLKEKLLIKVKGKTILQWTYENGKKVPNTDVVVATDSEIIAEEVKSFGGRSVLTPKDISSGTERVLYVADKVNYPIIINLQADEPMLSPKEIEKALFLVEEGGFVSTLCFRNTSFKDFNNPNNVKVILNKDGEAVYFSRAPIPYQSKEDFSFFFHHIGVYAFNSFFLKQILPNLTSSIDTLENLEQLKIIENNISVKIDVIEGVSVGIDTEGDLIKFNKYLEGKDG